MKANIYAIYTATEITEFISVQDIQEAILRQTHATAKIYIINDWPVSRNEITQEMRPYWILKDDLAVVD